jgi:hypothetical protein
MRRRDFLGVLSNSAAAWPVRIGLLLVALVGGLLATSVRARAETDPIVIRSAEGEFSVYQSKSEDTKVNTEKIAIYRSVCGAKNQKQLCG